MLLRIKSDSVCERTYPSTCHTATRTRFPSLLFSVVSKLLTHMGNQWMVSKVSGYKFSYCESSREEDMRECWGLRQGGKSDFVKKVIQILREVQTSKERPQRVRAWLELSSGAVRARPVHLSRSFCSSPQPQTVTVPALTKHVSLPSQEFHKSTGSQGIHFMFLTVLPRSALECVI